MSKSAPFWYGQATPTGIYLCPAGVDLTEGDRDLDLGDSLQALLAQRSGGYPLIKVKGHRIEVARGIPGQGSLESWVDDDEMVREVRARIEAIAGPVEPVLGIEWMYLFDWSRFGNGGRGRFWDELDKAFRTVPGYLPGTIFWYSPDSEAIPHLSASVEPPGLQVCGRVTERAWEAWHEAFAKAAGHLPLRND